MSGAEREDERDPRQPEPREPDAQLLAAAEAIADGREVDWEGTAPAGGAGPWQRLQAIAAVAAAHRTAAGAAPCEPLFRWGSLLVLERLGEGSFGEVFRCWDPELQREVALKLRRETNDEGRLRFLAEARRLARVRHPNVLVVHGAAVHDGRPGMWTDLLRGETLEQRLARAGPLGAEEAALAGCDLCRALAAVHAAGLVHGDVKAANVMREQGGRLVLMDFGAASEHDPGSPGARAGTPLGMAPEVLAGGAPTPQADLYSLGALLYRLVSGRHPLRAETVESLLARHAAGAATPLRDLCPALPDSFVAAVERSLAADPVARFASAGACERALRQVIAGAGAGADTRRRSRGVAGGLAVVALLATALGLWRRESTIDGPGSAGDAGTGARPQARSVASPPPLAPAVPSAESAGASAPTALAAADADARVEVALFRNRGGGEREALSTGATLRLGDRLHLEVRSSHPLYLYVVDADAAGALFTLFPLAGSELRNPLPAGLVRLPGSDAGTPLDWEVTSEGGGEVILVAASRRRVPEIEAQLAALAQASSGERRVTAASEAEPGRMRGIGGLVPTHPTLPRGLSSILAALDRTSGVRIWRFDLSGEPPDEG